MSSLFRLILAAGLSLALSGFSAGAQEYEREAGPTPPRLSLIIGEASLWRSGAEDWVQARLNLPLAAGDALYTGPTASAELQIGARAFVRMDERTQVELTGLEPDYLQFSVIAGRASFDLRTLRAGQSIEVDTPLAAFTLERAGYYVVEVGEDQTRFVTRRGGQATVTPADNVFRSVAPSEEVVLYGTGRPAVEIHPAPDLDGWDRWNFERSARLFESPPTRALPDEIYGADELDRYGRWRQDPRYGRVWIPDVAPDWVPYSTGEWIWDPYYGWTWLDDAPWGWAPFHYGRWVFVEGYWAWTPGPTLVRPVYAPALVAFFDFEPGAAVHVGIGAPSVSWVALGWGEPLCPWWGPSGFAGSAWWGGWGGPRVVNDVVVHHTTVVNVTNITYRNSRVPKAMLAVHRDRFGHGRVRPARADVAELRGARPVSGRLAVKPVPKSFVSGDATRQRPDKEWQSRQIVATKPPHLHGEPWHREEHQPGRERRTARIVTPEKQPQAKLPRPSFNGRDREDEPEVTRHVPPRAPDLGPDGRTSRDERDERSRRAAPQPDEAQPTGNARDVERSEKAPKSAPAPRPQTGHMPREVDATRPADSASGRNRPAEQDRSREESRRSREYASPKTPPVHTLPDQSKGNGNNRAHQERASEDKSGQRLPPSPRVKASDQPDQAASHAVTPKASKRTSAEERRQERSVPSQPASVPSAKDNERRHSRKQSLGNGSGQASAVQPVSSGRSTSKPNRNEKDQEREQTESGGQGQGKGRSGN
jgi:hypothetical protein